MQRIRWSFGAACAVFVAPAVAQDWQQIVTPTSPPGVGGHATAYDAARDRLVLFGGATATGRVNTTWLFDGITWSQATPASSPPARAGHPMAYDLGRQRVVLFGGVGVGGALNDTWEWDGVNWQQMTPATVPPGRLSHPLVYHPGRGTCVMHGGNSLAGTLTDTWEWNGVDWVQIPTANHPLPLRYAADMAYDAVGNGLVLFSGYPGALPDTWYFDGVNWTQRTTVNAPPGRWDHTLATDPIRGRIVLFGGSNTADTWEFDGVDWLQRTPATLPPGRYDDYMAYDLRRGQVVMFGGDNRNDTWVYQTPAQPGFATAIAYGEGCIDAASASLYELFAPNTFDMANLTLQFLPTGNGYAVLPTAPQWFTPTSANLGLGDDTVSAPLPLGFAFPYPGGSTTDVQMSSNGFVRLVAGGNSECCAGNVQLFLDGLPRFSGSWCDLNPAAGGSTHFDVDPANGAAYVTWLGVPEYGLGSTQTFQVAFFASGMVELRFGNCAPLTRQVLTGWTPGGGAKDPGSTDLSALAGVIVTSPDKDALWHRGDSRPVVGGTATLLTGGMPAGTLLGANVFGFTEFLPGIDLTALGMAGCHQYTSVDASQFLLPSGGLATVQLAVPNNPAFAGVVLRSQGLALVPGYTAAGAITSNGVRLTIDVQ